MVKTFPKLRGRIIEKYGSQVDFANQIGSTDVTVTNKLNGKYDFSMPDIIKWCKALEIGKDEVGAYFFADELQEN